jgi:hypothetical protein
LPGIYKIKVGIDIKNEKDDIGNKQSKWHVFFLITFFFLLGLVLRPLIDLGPLNLVV